MRNRLAFIFVVFLMSAGLKADCAFPKPASSIVLTYSFEPIVSDSTLKLRVTLEFKGGPEGHSKLELPSEWAGQKNTEKSVSELQAISSDTVAADTESSSEKQLTYPPNTLVRVSYILVKDWTGPLNSGTRFRADLSPAYLHMIGTTSLVHPKFSRFDVVDARFDWSKLPPSWSLASSFGADERCQSFHGAWEKVAYSLFVGGDYRIYRTSVAKNALVVAIRGKWGFSDDEWVSKVRRIIAFEREFWQDNDFPYFLVTLTPLDRERGSHGGTALTNSFMEHLSRQDSPTVDILGQIAHETFHGWNPGKIGDPAGSEYLVSWFFEGFTVYYADVMLYRAGLLSFPDYVDATNRKIRTYELGEGTNVSLDEFIRRHGAKYDVLNQLDSRRGAVLALWLDAAIRKTSRHKHSLDDVMFDLAAQNAHYQRTNMYRSLDLTNGRIFGAASRYIRKEDLKSLREYVERGGSIRLPADALGPCALPHDESADKFDLGFDQPAKDEKMTAVSGVDPNSEAYKTGVRDGEQVIRLSFKAGDAQIEVKLIINKEGEISDVTYYPRKEVSFQQFTLDSEKYQADSAKCSGL